MTHPPIRQNNNRNDLTTQHKPKNDALTNWLALYFEVEVTTLPSSRKVQKRDIELFIRFMQQEEGEAVRPLWTPRLSGAFKLFLQNVYEEEKRRWNDTTINRILAHVKTFAGWIHKMAPFPLGNSMDKIRGLPVGSRLDIERALTKSERRRLLDAADLLTEIGGKSKDRNRYQGKDRPVRKGYRPYRNRAIIYTLLETGMRREAVTRIRLREVDFDRAVITVAEKGSARHTYTISDEGLNAIRDYLEKERAGDADVWKDPELFLASRTVTKKKGSLSPQMVNRIWNDAIKTAGVNPGKTPHSARHAMGKFIMDETGNPAAVQRQLGHKNAAYSMQYARATGQEINRLLNNRE